MNIRTGVHEFHSEALFEAINDGIDLTFEDYADEHREECTDGECIDKEHCDYFEDFELDNSTVLIGDWKRDRNSLFVPDEDGLQGFSAIVSSMITQVVWSKTVGSFKSMCSPCYPDQVDCDSGEGDLLAYTPPKEFLTDD